MDQQLPDLVGEEIVDGRPKWRWSDGTLTPVVRGGAVSDDDEDEDDGVDDDDADVDEDDESESEEDDDDADDEEGDDEDDDEDAEYEAAVDDIVARVVDKLGDKFDSIADRRINKLVKRLDRKADRGDDDEDRPRSRRSRRNTEPDFSVREAKAAGMEIVRDELGRMSTEDREMARDLLTVEIDKRRSSGDDEDEVGEAAAKAVVTRMKSMRSRTSKSTKAALQRSGALKTPAKQKAKTSTKKSVKSQMQAGAARAARVRPSQTEKE